MNVVDTMVIGAGHAGLAVSRCLTDRGIEHVVLERGRLAERWRSARWDSFRLLTPNWLTRLPGRVYDGPDPDGFMGSAELVGQLEAYAAGFAAPVLDRTPVTDVRPEADGYQVRTDTGGWRASNVVIATGYHSRALVPPFAAALPADIAQVTPAGYRSPERLPAGAVLVVGASASGVQIADELARAGREVIVAVGAHTRLPRRYRGRDMFWWLDRTGSLDRTRAEVPDARTDREPSLQLTGDDRAVDLAALRDRGVRLAGRFVDLHGGVARFADDLTDTVAAADIRMRRVLSTIDRYAGGLSGVPNEDPPRPVTVPRGPSRLDLGRAGIGAVVWATGSRPSYPWLAVPVLDTAGRLRHRRGVTEAPGLYAVGLRFQHRRRSTLIDGAGEDAAFLVDHIVTQRQATTGRQTVGC